MKVAGDRLRGKFVKLLETLDNALECLVSFLGFKVADVLADKNLVTDGCRNRVLLVCSNRQDRGSLRFTSTGNGAKPRLRRITSSRPATTRTIESSV